MNSFHTKRRSQPCLSPGDQMDREWAQQSVACALKEKAHFPALTWGGEWIPQHPLSALPLADCKVSIQ